ncbi:MAG: hypothetical protein [Caudoviricetes sp.]|nr:MAG: hypothetical protein [Caudoviricetes sp.]
MTDCIDHGQKGSTCRGKVAGYGRCNFEGKVTGCHRKAYCVAAGVSLASIDGLVVRHTCDNPRCINPEHLKLGTASDNMQDRERGMKAMRGQGNPAAKLTPRDVKEIKYLYNSGGVTQLEIAKQFGIGQPQVSAIIRGASWK